MSLGPGREGEERRPGAFKRIHMTRTEPGVSFRKRQIAIIGFLMGESFTHKSRSVEQSNGSHTRLPSRIFSAVFV